MTNQALVARFAGQAMAGDPALSPYQAVAIGKAMARDGENQTAKPRVEPTPDEAIVVVVQVFVEFVNAKRQEEGMGPMSEDEEKDWRAKMTEIFSKVLAGARTSASALQIAKEFLPWLGPELPGG